MTPVAGLRFRTILALFAVLAVLCVAGAGAAASLFGPQGSRAAIEGVVLSAGGVEPVPEATVTVIRMDRAAGGAPAAPVRPLAILTERDGGFAFRDLEPGTYNLVAAAAGYVREQSGRHVPGGAAAIVAIAAGEAIRNVALRLTPTGDVGGRISDSGGRPAVGVSVQLLRNSFNARGQRSLQTVTSMRTNDRGEYRFYWLTPGSRWHWAGRRRTRCFSTSCWAPVSVRSTAG